MILRLALFLAFLGAVLYVAPQLAQKQTAPAPSARPIPASPTVAPALASRIADIDAALRQATQTGRSVPITLRVTEADLTAAVQQYFPQTYAGITVSDPSVRLGPELLFSAKASSLFLSGPLVASATPYAIDGRLAVRLDSATVGGVALPDPVRSQLQAQMQNALNAAISTRLQVAGVSVATGFATISGNALP